MSTRFFHSRIPHCEDSPRKKAFTSLEMLLVISVFGIVTALIIPVSQVFQLRNDLHSTASRIVGSLSHAQIFARASRGDSAWGVYVQPGNFILFKGTSFSSRDPLFDEPQDFPSSIIPGGLQEVVFEKFSGEPTSIGTIMLTTWADDTRTITISAKGVVQ